MARVAALKNVDFPTFGFPTIPTRNVIAVHPLTLRLNSYFYTFIFTNKIALHFFLDLQQLLLDLIEESRRSQTSMLCCLFWLSLLRIGLT